MLAFVRFAIGVGDRRYFDASRAEYAVDAGLVHLRIDDAVEEDFLLRLAERKVIADRRYPLPPFGAVLVERMHNERSVDHVPDHHETDDGHRCVGSPERDEKQWGFEGAIVCDGAQRFNPGMELIEDADPDEAPEVHRHETQVSAAKNKAAHVISPQGQVNFTTMALIISFVKLDPTYLLDYE